MAKYINKKRIEGLTLKEGDLVYLLRKNVKIKRPSGKLNYTKLSPFMVKDKLRTVIYRLALPKDIKIHLVFYISLLKPTLRNVKLIKLVPLDDDINVYNY